MGKRLHRRGTNAVSCVQLGKGEAMPNQDVIWSNDSGDRYEGPIQLVQLEEGYCLQQDQYGVTEHINLTEDELGDLGAAIYDLLSEE